MGQTLAALLGAGREIGLGAATIGKDSMSGSLTIWMSLPLISFAVAPAKPQGLISRIQRSRANRRVPLLPNLMSPSTPTAPPGGEFYAAKPAKSARLGRFRRTVWPGRDEDSLWQ